MFGLLIHGIIRGFNLKSYEKERSLCELKGFEFSCGCKVYSDEDFKTHHLSVVNCSKHMKQLYELTKYVQGQKAMDEYYEAEKTVGYYLVRECKTCHILVDSVISKLVAHLHYLKPSKQQNPNEVKHQ